MQEAAAYALGEICSKSGVPPTPEAQNALCDALNRSPDPAVQRSAAVALGTMGRETPAILTALRGQAGNASVGVRQNVAWALGQVGNDNVGVLTKLLGDADPQVKMNAANAVAEHDADKGRKALDALLACCNDRDGELRRAAVLALVRLVTPEDAKKAGPLIAALGDSDAEVRNNAAMALGNIGGETGKQAVPLLRGLLNTGDLEYRKKACAALKNIGTYAAEAAPDLQRALKDRDAEMRRYAAVALGGLEVHAEKAVPDLAAMVQDAGERMEVRADAAVALSRIGPVPAAKTAAPGLLKVIEDPAAPMRVRERALWALRVHREKMVDIPGLFPAMAKLMTDAREPDAKMLRYDCAYLLGIFERDKAPKATMDVLLEFLRDDKIQIYAGTGGKVEGSSAEKTIGGAKVTEKRIGDGRVMAVQSLSQMASTTAGRKWINETPAVMTQLRTLSQDMAIYEQLRKDTNKLLEKLQK